jgi:hypothetical protein
MPTYEVLQLEAKSGKVIASLPFTSLEYSDVLNAAGAAAISVPLDAADPNTLVPGRSALVVTADGEPQWGGILWAASADLAAGTLALNASGWFSYYSFCYLASWTPVGGAGGRLGQYRGYSGKKDQTLMLRDWIESANDNDGIATDTSRLLLTSFEIRRRAWKFSEFKNVAEAINEIADEDGGFNFRFESYWGRTERPWEPPARVGNRIILSPKLSQTFPTLTHRVDVDVSQVSYDGSKLASEAWAFGADTGTGVKAYQRVTNTLPLTPRLQQVTTYSDLKTTAELNPKAAAMAAVGRSVIAIPSLELYPGVYDRSLFRPGMYGVVKATSGYVRLSDDFVITERRIAVDVNGTESVALSLASKEVFVSDSSN